MTLTVEDRLDIAALQAAYAIGMDRVDRDSFKSVWRESSQLRGEAIGLDADGLKAVMAFFDNRIAKAVPLPAEGGVVRVAGNHLISEDGGVVRGVVEFVAHRLRNGVLAAYSAGFYDDVYDHDGSWFISERVMNVVHLPEVFSGK